MKNYISFQDSRSVRRPVACVFSRKQRLTRGPVACGMHLHTISRFLNYILQRLRSTRGWAASAGCQIFFFFNPLFAGCWQFWSLPTALSIWDSLTSSELINYFSTPLPKWLKSYLHIYSSNIHRKIALPEYSNPQSTGMPPGMRYAAALHKRLCWLAEETPFEPGRGHEH
jgi:hypothetical protein